MLHRRSLPNATDAVSLIGALTAREKDVVKGLACGLTAEQICSQLHIGYGTYKSHKINIKRKMNGLPVWGWPAIWFLAEGANHG